MNITNPRPCPACRLANGRLGGVKNGFEIFVCRGCKSIYTGHIPSLSEAQDYDEYYTDKNLSVPDFINIRVREILDGFAAFRETNRLLDIGFGAGNILEAAEEKEWEVFGQEVSKPAVDQATERGYKVFHGDLTEAAYPDNYFDVVTASEILEHLPNPENVLSEIVRILRPGGLFWGTTPSAGGLSFKLLKLKWSTLSPPEHTQLYSKKGLEIMLKKAGFPHFSFKTFGLNPPEIINHFHPSNNTANFNPGETAYRLNESLTKSPFRKMIKSGLNDTLNLLQIGIH